MHVCAALAARLPGREVRAVGLPEPQGGVGGPLDWQLAWQVPATQLGALLRVEDALRLALQAGDRGSG
jgi:hypothetical protein